jgi:hypothetical protein
LHPAPALLLQATNASVVYVNAQLLRIAGLLEAQQQVTLMKLIQDPERFHFQLPIDATSFDLEKK